MQVVAYAIVTFPWLEWACLVLPVVGAIVFHAFWTGRR